eukprot:754207-Hanusia_phi.AAC.1
MKARSERLRISEERRNWDARRERETREDEIKGGERKGGGAGIVRGRERFSPSAARGAGGARGARGAREEAGRKEKIENDRGIDKVTPPPPPALTVNFHKGPLSHPYLPLSVALQG